MLIFWEHFEQTDLLTFKSNTHVTNMGKFRLKTTIRNRAQTKPLVALDFRKTKHSFLQFTTTKLQLKYLYG